MEHGFSKGSIRARFRTMIKSLPGVALLACAATLAQAQVVGVATNPQGTLYYSVGTAVASVMQQKANIPTRVQPMSGSSAYAPLLNRGEIEFGLMNALDVVNAFNGVDNFKGRKNPDLRLVGVMFALPIGMAVPNDSPAKSMKDLKGFRVPSQFTAQSTIASVQDAALATGGVSIADMKPYPVANYLKGMQALGEGKVDAALFGLGTAAAQEANVALASHGGLRFIPLTDTPEALAAMRKVFSSAYSQVFEPSPALPGVVTPTRLMVYSAFLVTSKHTSDEVVYKATKALFENKEALAAGSATMKTFDPNLMAEKNEVPFHPGAEKFYKEAKQWPPKQR
jgi:TRAP transporter TAXI family solute receptor